MHRPRDPPLSASPVAPIASRASRIPRPAPPSALPMLMLIGLVTLCGRLAVLPHSTLDNMDDDSAHFMNVARCFARGQGFSNPAAWPAWMKPERLPMPETFKEPGYPWAIATLTPAAGSPFRAGQLISLLAGLLTPFLVWMLARRLEPERAVADLAGLIAAASPLLVAQSTRVMVESAFTAACMLVWVLLAPPLDNPGRHARARDLARDAAGGIALGVAFLLRAQTLIAAPAIAVLLATGSGTRATALRRAAIVLAMAALTASPFLLRNLRLFGSPFHSDVAVFGLMPYRDVIDLSATLERPEAPISWALRHLPQIAATTVSNAALFVVRILPAAVLGNPVWMVALVAGALLSAARWRRWLFLHVFLLTSASFLFAVSHDPRYFVSSTPLLCLLAAPGAWWLARGLAPLPLLGPLRGRHLLLATLAALLVLGPLAARRDVMKDQRPENTGARAQAPFLMSHLAADEAVMTLSTAYVAYWTDRATVYLVIADPPGFMEVVRRYRVRYATLPTSRLPDLALRYSDRRLPPALTVDHVDAAHDLTVFQVHDPQATSGR